MEQKYQILRKRESKVILGYSLHINLKYILNYYIREKQREQIMQFSWESTRSFKIIQNLVKPKGYSEKQIILILGKKHKKNKDFFILKLTNQGNKSKISDLIKQFSEAYQIKMALFEEQKNNIYSRMRSIIIQEIMDISF